MLAQCIDQFRQGACATCDRRDDCPLGWWEQLADRLAAGRAAAPPPRGPDRPGPIMAFLGEVAKGIATRTLAQARVRAHAHAGPRLGPFRREVEDHLEPLLESGDLRIDAVARSLGLSRQTLYRRLKAEGVTFAELLDGLRRRLALRYIREQGRSVKETAWRLGFSDPAAFSRAFKRWTGASPRARPR